MKAVERTVLPLSVSSIERYYERLGRHRGSYGVSKNATHRYQAPSPRFSVREGPILSMLISEMHRGFHFQDGNVDPMFGLRYRTNMFSVKFHTLCIAYTSQ